MIRRYPGVTLVAAVFVVVWGLITHGTFAGTGDEPHYLIAAHSIAFDGDLDLANDYRDAALVTGGTLEPEDHARLHDGRLRPMHDVGMPLLFAPLVRVAYPIAEGLAAALPATWLQAARLDGRLILRHQISLLMALITGLLARELFLLFRTLGGSTTQAFWWALLFALSPPILSHAYLFFTEVPTALVALFVFRRLSLQPIQRPAAALGLGVVTGLLLIVHARNVGLVAGFSLIALLHLRRGSMSIAACGRFLSGVAAGVVARTLVTFALWGSFFTTPHASPGETASLAVTAREVFIRFTGLLADREHGLLAYSPLYLLAIAGLFVLARSRRALWHDVALVLVAYLVPILLPQVNFHGWRGGWSPAARFLVPIAPLFALAAYTYAQAGSRRLVGALVAVQVAINAYVWQFPKTLWNEGTGQTAFAAAGWLPTWTEPTLTQSLLFTGLLCGVVLFGYACSAATMPRTAGSAEAPRTTHNLT